MRVVQRRPQDRRILLRAVVRGRDLRVSEAMRTGRTADEQLLRLGHRRVVEAEQVRLASAAGDQQHRVADERLDLQCDLVRALWTGLAVGQPHAVDGVRDDEAVRAGPLVHEATLDLLEQELDRFLGVALALSDEFGVLESQLVELAAGVSEVGARRRTVLFACACEAGISRSGAPSRSGRARRPGRGPR